jgi:hypothetical protein
MLKELVMLLSCGTMTYVWLCAIVSPIGSAVRSLVRDGAGGAAWAAVALAAGGAVLWTAILGGGILLAMMLEPRAGMALLRSDAGWRGLSLGNIVWVGELLAFARAPRLGPTFETATALAIVAIVRDVPGTLSRVERLYRAHAVAEAPRQDAESGAVRGVAA